MGVEQNPTSMHDMFAKMGEVKSGREKGKKQSEGLIFLKQYCQGLLNIVGGLSGFEEYNRHADNDGYLWYEFAPKDSTGVLGIHIFAENETEADWKTGRFEVCIQSHKGVDDPNKLAVATQAFKTIVNYVKEAGLPSGDYELVKGETKNP